VIATAGDPYAATHAGVAAVDEFVDRLLRPR
jgi:hypothetical protein